MLDNYTSRASVLSPALNTPIQGAVLPGREPPWEPRTQLVEQLSGVDIWELFKSAAYQRPYAAHGSVISSPGGGVDDLSCSVTFAAGTATSGGAGRAVVADATGYRASDCRLRR
jgi:hypothetical protein